eukprot:COSAG02_NODE_3273_length_7032_cov_32.221405_4_plen_90_part_00
MNYAGIITSFDRSGRDPEGEKSKKNEKLQPFFFDWWISDHRATPLVGVALINVSQCFFFSRSREHDAFGRNSSPTEAYDQTSLYSCTGM